MSSKFEAKVKILDFVGKTVDMRLKKGRLENVRIDEILVNQLTHIPNTIYYTKLEGGAKGLVKYDAVASCSIRTETELEEPKNVPEIIRRGEVKTYL